MTDDRAPELMNFDETPCCDRMETNQEVRGRLTTPVVAV